jgi:proteic killer suppression protein
MIQSFRHKGLQKFYEKGDFSKIQPSHRKKIRLILSILNAATEIRDMNFPGSYLHRLTGNLDKYWSVSVSGNWRIVFIFEDGDAFDVDYLDYH